MGYAFLSSQCSTSFMFSTNYIKSFNECICSSIFSLLCHLHQSETPFLSITFILICILEALRTQLHILEIPIDLFILLPTYLLFYLHPIIALFVFYVLYFFKLYFMYTYYFLSEINII